MFNDPAVLSYTAVKNKRRIGKLKKKKNESFSLFIISLELNMNCVNVLCAKKKYCSPVHIMFLVISYHLYVMFQVVCAVHFIAIGLPSKESL